MRPAVVRGPRGPSLRCSVAETRSDRIRGALGREPGPGEALLIPGASSIHTFGMRAPILVARLDRDLRVVEVRRVPPRRLLPPSRAAHVLEAHVATDLRLGDALRIVPDPGARPGREAGSDSLYFLGCPLAGGGGEHGGARAPIV